MLTQALLVDDSRSVLNFLKRLIEADGNVQATAFTDPVQAMAAATDQICASQRATRSSIQSYSMGSGISGPNIRAIQSSRMKATAFSRRAKAWA